MSTSLDQRAFFGTERSVAGASFTGAAQSLGTLSESAVILILRNESNKNVFFADNTGSTEGMTFIPGMRLVLDLRCQHGVAEDFRWDKNTRFFITSATAGGTGSFYMSVVCSR